MPTGTNDFNQPLATDPTSPGQGIAQTGNRLLMGGGSNSASGRWIWASGFEDGLAEWGLSGGGVTLTDAAVYQGKQAAYLITTNIIGNSQELSKILYAQGQRFGFEVLVKPQYPSEVLIVASGPNEDASKRAIFQFVIKNAPPNSALYVRVGATDTLVGALPSFTVSASYYHYFKAVFDPYNNAFVRCFVDGYKFELNNFPGQLAAGVDTYIYQSIKIKTTTAAIVTMHVDNAVITADEP